MEHNKQQKRHACRQDIASQAGGDADGCSCPQRRSGGQSLNFLPVPREEDGAGSKKTDARHHRLDDAHRIEPQPVAKTIELNHEQFPEADEQRSAAAYQHVRAQSGWLPHFLTLPTNDCAKRQGRHESNKDLNFDIHAAIVRISAIAFPRFR